MSQFTGLVFDSYDDTTGEVLKSVVPDMAGLPTFVKEAHRISPAESDAVPDDNYALVLIKQGHKHRKFATIDPGNTALSVLYLLKQAHLLPTKAVKVAAHNLMEACERHGIEAPDHLKIAAKTGVSGVSGESQQPYLRKELNALAEKDFPMPEPPGETTLNPQLGKVDPADPAIKAQTNYASNQGTNPVSSLGGSDKEKTAEADQATRDMFSSGDIATTRRQNYRTSPYVGMEDWEPGADLEKKASAPVRTLLRGQYPIDSYDQVKTASAYFEVNTRKFDPRDRREYCIKLASRMEELGIKVPDSIDKYASVGYGADVDSYVGFRRQYAAEEFHPTLDLLLEKRAQVSPGTFADALEDFDKIAQIHHYWDSEIPDPYFSTFGPSMDKIASDEWRWDEQGVRIDEDDLQNLSVQGRALIVESFGENFADEFAKGPKTFFNALPTPQKLLVGRMAMDRDSGTGTE